jgi:hypothetical protein
LFDIFGDTAVIRLVAYYVIVEKPLPWRKTNFFCRHCFYTPYKCLNQRFVGDGVHIVPFSVVGNGQNHIHMILHNDISIQTYIRVSAASQNAIDNLAVFRQLNVRWDARDAVDSVPYDVTEQFRAVFGAYRHKIRAVAAVIISL